MRHADIRMDGGHDRLRYRGPVVVTVEGHEGIERLRARLSSETKGA